MTDSEKLLSSKIMKLATLLASERCPPYKVCTHIKEPRDEDDKFIDDICIQCFIDWPDHYNDINISL